MIDKKFQQINVRLTVDEYQAFMRVCSERGASYTKVVCLLVERYIENPEQALGIKNDSTPQATRRAAR